MFCPKCGTDLKEMGGVFCPKCGSKLPSNVSSEMGQQSNGTENQRYDAYGQSSETTVLTNYPIYHHDQQAGADTKRNPTSQDVHYDATRYNGAPNQGYQYHPVGASNTVNVSAVCDLPMRWYKFIIYVQLFLYAVVSLGNTAMIFTGTALGGSEYAELAYAFFPGLKPLMLFVGVATLVLAVFAIVVRQWLASYKFKGILGLYGLNIATTVVNLISAFGVASIVGGQIQPTSVSSAISGVVLLVINMKYFSRRRHLFQ